MIFASESSGAQASSVRDGDALGWPHGAHVICGYGGSLSQDLGRLRSKNAQKSTGKVIIETELAGCKTLKFFKVEQNELARGLAGVTRGNTLFNKASTAALLDKRETAAFAHRLEA